MPEPADLQVLRDYYPYSGWGLSDWSNLDNCQFAVETMEKGFAAAMATLRGAIAIERSRVVSQTGIGPGKLAAHPSVLKSLPLSSGRSPLEDIALRVGEAWVLQEAITEAVKPVASPMNVHASLSGLQGDVTWRIRRLTECVNRAPNTARRPESINAGSTAGRPDIAPPSSGMAASGKPSFFKR